MSEQVDDTRHCWFCDKTTNGRYITTNEWLCWACGTVEDLTDYPSKDHAEFRAQIQRSLRDPEYLDRLAAHLQSTQWKEPLANPKPITELHTADLHDGYYEDQDGDEL
jgi:hypothetical protein